MTRRTGKCRNGVAGWRLGCTLPDRSRLERSLRGRRFAWAVPQQHSLFACIVGLQGGHPFDPSTQIEANIYLTNTRFCGMIEVWKAHANPKPSKKQSSSLLFPRTA